MRKVVILPANNDLNRGDQALIWETISFVITLIAIYILQKDMGVSLKFTFALTIVKVIFLYNYERIWKKIMWGKVYAEINSRV